MGPLRRSVVNLAEPYAVGLDNLSLLKTIIALYCFCHVEYPN